MKQQLVDAIRMLERAGIIDHNGHCSARRDAVAFHINSGAAVTVGKDVIEAFVLARYLEENAYRQYMALQIGTPYVFTEAEQQASREKLQSPSLFKKTWDHYYSKLK